MKYVFVVIIALTILGAYCAYKLIKDESKYTGGGY